ncbi:cupin domain-containing protein [Rhodobacter sp. KR11]|uniref:cupin domain-containing protein n=1 Tax=Rhodobacter sp. KR11 TaxID=2974588 RepID=UPI002222ABB3|nr:cupin domain-containing protein [Rhodobacter sp. KR11]MCW1918584.1 cupin domain-containing protein [Rhodobacter sp. KR11]
MEHLIAMTRQGVTPETSRPPRVVEGDPIHTTWNIEERQAQPAQALPGEGQTPHGADKGMLYAGLWHTTPGAWTVNYEEWEYIRILEGVSVLIDEQGVETRLQAGDSHIIRPGFKGIWRCIEPTLKDYVILA